MNKEEIKEYLKKVDKLEIKLQGQDKDTLQWLIFGYNQCAKLLYEKEKQLADIKFYIEQSNIKDMLWGKEILKIINDENESWRLC